MDDEGMAEAVPPGAGANSEGAVVALAGDLGAVPGSAGAPPGGGAKRMGRVLKVGSRPNRPRGGAGGALNGSLGLAPGGAGEAGGEGVAVLGGRPSLPPPMGRIGDETVAAPDDVTETDAAEARVTVGTEVRTPIAGDPPAAAPPAPPPAMGTLELSGVGMEPACARAAPVGVAVLLGGVLPVGVPFVFNAGGGVAALPAAAEVGVGGNGMPEVVDAERRRSAAAAAVAAAAACSGATTVVVAALL